MCTVTWLRPRPGEYAVLFNRDEKRTRLPARPPREDVRGGMRYVAPADGDAGGAWLAVNQRGLTVGILNHYEAEQGWRSFQPRSRGQLVLSLVECPDAGEVGRRLAHLNAADYHAFILVAFDDQGLSRCHTWDGRHLMARDLTDGDLPLTTSSFDTSSVLAHRRLAFRRARETQHGLSLDSLRRFHDSRDARGGAYSVAMSRDDAQTVSFSRVSVTAATVEFYYEPREGVSLAGDPVLVTLGRS